MLSNVKNAAVKVSSGSMDYIRFGSGRRILVMLPGLGDGLRTVKGTAMFMAAGYRVFFRDFTVYAFSRINELVDGYTTRHMARDLSDAMDQLGIEKADILGVSMGGMIAQHFAADYPEKVNKLVLTVTAARPNPVLRESVEEWIALARQGNHTALMDSNLRKIYSDGYYRKNKWLTPVVGRLTKPKSYDRFFVQAAACLAHDAFHRLEEISAPTFVVGGGKDLTLGAESSKEIAEKIPGARLHIYDQWGHGLYEEAKDFNSLVIDFLKQ